LSRAGKTGVERSYRWLRNLIVLILLVNIVAVSSIAVFLPEVSLGELLVEYSVDAVKVLVAINGTGWVKPPLYYNQSSISMSVLIKNLSITTVNAEIMEYGGERIAPLDFTGNGLLDYEYFKNLSVIPDIKIKLNIEPYPPTPASIVSLREDGCYTLLFNLVAQLNITMDFCHYYINPSLIVINREDATAVLNIDVYHENGALENRVLRVQSRTTTKLDFSGYSRIVIRSIQLDYLLYSVDERLRENSGVGEKVLILSKNIQLVLIPLNALVVVVYFAYTKILAGKSGKRLKRKK
jgi:hypothetical protein